jgi:uncharacterized membrane protein (UPF0127 family)/phosphatidylglycerophosphate synthase
MKPADCITLFRIFLGLPMIAFAYYGSSNGFAFFLLAAASTDILDGYVARKLKQATEYGKRFDIIADNFIVMCTAAGIFFLSREMLLHFRWHILSLFTYYLFVQAANIIINKKPVFMRSFSANLAAIVFPFMAISILYGITILIYVYIFLMFCSLTEKLSATMPIRKTFLVLLTLPIAVILLIYISLLPQPADNVCFEDGFCIMAEIRDTPETRAQGLMHWESLEEDQGMLFVFEEPSRYTFWMMNMLIPIDIIFLDSEKRIVHIFENVQPCNEEPCDLYTPASEALYVVETKAGFSSRHNLEKGQQVYFN